MDLNSRCKNYRFRLSTDKVAVLSILNSLRTRRCRVGPHCLAFEPLRLVSNPTLNRAVLKMSEALIAPGGFSPHKIRMQGKPTGQALRCKSILRGLFVLREQSSSVLDISPRALAPAVRYVSCRWHGTLETATSATVILYRVCGMAGRPQLLTPFFKVPPFLFPPPQLLVSPRPLLKKKNNAPPFLS